VRKHPSQVRAEDIRSYLSTIQDKSAYTRANVLKSLKRFFRDFLQRPEIVASFKFPKRVYAPKQVPIKEDLQRFFDALDDLRDKTVFLLYATTGLRRNELLSVTVDEVDTENRIIIPRNAHKTGTTKNNWVSCFNGEAENHLRRYLANRGTDDNRLFPQTETAFRKAFNRANNKTDLHITPQVLRDWFCCQLGELGVPDRYVDAFCGRVPKSVLARHYTDYSPDKLKRIYDKANLTVLT